MKEIGGYFELEIENKNSFLHKEAILLNSARNCLEYAIKAQNIQKIFIPKYTCDVILEPLKKTATAYEFYSINKDFELAKDTELQDGEYLLYVNYWGIKDSYVKALSDKYKSALILDNSQAFYSMPKKDITTFYSPRKFFGVPDGGCLYTNKTIPQDLEQDYSHERTSHLIKRLDKNAEFGFEDFRRNDNSLSNQEIKLISDFTHRILNSINYETSKQKRLNNFAHLHKTLKDKNEIKSFDGENTCPMVYPFLIKNNNLRAKLIENKVFVATYWANVLDWANPTEIEYYLTKYLLPLPIDQRYDINDMEKILEIICKYL